MLKKLYDFKENLNQKGIFFCFSGPISQELLVEIVAILKQKMKLKEASNTTIIRVFSMVVELAQNIIHYSAEKIPKDTSNHDELSLGIISVGYEGDHYFVLCGNMIRKKDVERLRKKLIAIQGMNKEDLKKYYREKRKLSPEEGSKGAGLGIIEIARKAVQPIEFDFQDIDESYSFYSFKTLI